jgi:predicted Zn finger-like uncharacterized protein
MIIQCPQCQQRYFLDDDVLGSKGRMVRCSYCHHSWKQSLASLEGRWLAVIPQNFEENSQKNSRRSSDFLPKPWWKGIALYTCQKKNLFKGILIGITIIAIGKFGYPIYRIAPEYLRNIYKNLRRTNHLVLYNVTTKKEWVGHQWRMIILGTVLNQDVQERPLHSLRIDFFTLSSDQAQEPQCISTQYYALGKATLAPQGKKEIQLILTDIPENFSYVLVRIQE